MVKFRLDMNWYGSFLFCLGQAILCLNIEVNEMYGLAFCFVYVKFLFSFVFRLCQILFFGPEIKRHGFPSVFMKNYFCLVSRGETVGFPYVLSWLILLL